MRATTGESSTSKFEHSDVLMATIEHLCGQSVDAERR